MRCGQQVTLLINTRGQLITRGTDRSRGIGDDGSVVGRVLFVLFVGGGAVHKDPHRSLQLSSAFHPSAEALTFARRWGL